METELHVFTCDGKDCDERVEADEYPGPHPRNWIRLDFDVPRTPRLNYSTPQDNGVRHFCSWAHAARFCNDRADKERR